MLFVQEFTHDRGDVVYGLGSERMRYLVSWAQAKVAEVEVAKACGDYSEHEKAEYESDKRTAERLPFRPRLMINDYNAPVASGDFSDPAAPRLYRASDLRVRDYTDELSQHGRYAPHQAAALDRGALAKDDQRFADDTQQLSPQERELAYRVHAVRRACKFGIEYISTLPGPARVHYVLDGINLDEVVSQAVRDLWVGTQGVPITTSELRYVFRRWARYKDTQRVVFYRDGMSTRAPWIEEPAKWVPYARHRVEKHRGRINPALAAQFMGYAQANRPGPALHTFFQIDFPA